jgi:cytoskeletal protein CcmA (bactofilin family)
MIDRQFPRAHATPTSGSGGYPTVFASTAKALRPTALGREISVVGEVTAQQDFILAGRIDGSIDLPEHALTIDEGAHMKGDAFAKSIIVGGVVSGNLTAIDRIEVLATARVEGDLTAPQIGVELGAQVSGRLDMKRTDAAIRVARYRRERK